MDVKERDRRRVVARELGLDISDISSAVDSWFGAVIHEGRRLPFSRATRIYTLEAFNEKAPVVNIPYIGRFGPAYGKYLKWRGSEAEGVSMIKREMASRKYQEVVIEELAERALSGERISSTKIGSRLPNGAYSKIWMIGSGSRKAAGQLIKKQEKG